MTQIKAVVFDAGGTLVRTARPVGEIYAEVGRRHGREWDAVALQKSFKEAFKKMRGNRVGPVPSDGDDRDWWREVVRQTLGDESGSIAFEDYFGELYPLFERPDLWHVFPDVVPVLDRLKREGCRLVVLSNWDSRLRTMLARLELAPYFENLFISTECGFEKPDAAFYRLAQKALGISPGEILMVGDDPENDVAAPRRQGWQALLIERPRETLAQVLELLT
jgi:putative hydrolase of the HAD superfamily